MNIQIGKIYSFKGMRLYVQSILEEEIIFQDTATGLVHTFSKKFIEENMDTRVSGDLRTVSKRRKKRTKRMSARRQRYVDRAYIWEN